MLKISIIFLVKNFDSLHERGIKISPSHPNFIHIYNRLKTILLKKKTYANLQSILLSANSISNFQVSKSIVIKKHEKYLYQTKRTKGGSKGHLSGGPLPPLLGYWLRKKARKNSKVLSYLYHPES